MCAGQGVGFSFLPTDGLNTNSYRKVTSYASLWDVEQFSGVGVVTSSCPAAFYCLVCPRFIFLYLSVRHNRGKFVRH